MSTITDVAEEAGVSRSTVSRVLSGSDAPIKPATREKVLEVVAKLGFRPNAVARSLSGKRTYTVGVLVSDIGNPFYADVIKGVEDAGLPEGYNLFLGNTNFDLERGTTLIHSLIDRRVDGVIILFSRTSKEWLTTLAGHNIPVTVVDPDASLPTLESVSIKVDFRPGIRAAVEHLVGLGHWRFAHVSGPLDLQTSRHRRDVFLEELAARGIKPSHIQCEEGDFHIEGGREAARRLFDRKTWPTAIFTANDLMALGVLGEAHARDLRVPQDLSVIGLDDIWPAAHSTPPLSTVAMPRYQIGFQAMSRLMKHLKEAKPKRKSSQEISLATQLVIRESTAPPRR
ncbi:LacI family transcriptional regulator [Geothrix limicola]|uniref:LacI family transcriptional regulator n=1 Tax=Geothrix limicola TaxID=2927978 RepID=A0ABQ5QBA9_9BACT|nr:LacI family DNA-binding transcriptional regulator [Geothrix limicola]GLH71746.1 LacI family transcriptional regulator [Geothrix limicola]